MPDEDPLRSSEGIDLVGARMDRHSSKYVQIFKALRMTGCDKRHHSTLLLILPGPAENLTLLIADFLGTSLFFTLPNTHRRPQKYITLPSYKNLTTQPYRKALLAPSREKYSPNKLVLRYRPGAGWRIAPTL